MNGVIFLETLRRSWKQIIYWGLGFAIYAFYPFILMPDNEGLQGYGDLLETMDEGVLRAVGIDGSAAITSPEGFIGYAFFGFLLLVISVFAVIAGLNITAVEEENGAMDMLLSLPIQRWQVVVEKFLAYSVMIVGIALFGFVGLLGGNQVTNLEVNITVWQYLEGVFNLIPGALLVMAFTAFVATFVRRRVFAASIAGGFVVISYLVDIVGRVANSDPAEAIRQVSIFSHYNGSRILIDGIGWGGAIGILICAVLLVGLAMQLFNQRDIAV